MCMCPKCKRPMICMRCVASKAGKASSSTMTKEQRQARARKGHQAALAKHGLTAKELGAKGAAIKAAKMLTRKRYDSVT